MKKYETIFILDPDLEEEPSQSVVEKIKGIITQNQGEIVKVEDWGKRKLAYEVKKKSKGHYFLIHFLGSAPLLSELERNFRVMDAVIKYQSVRLDDRQSISSQGPIMEEPQEAESEPTETT
ncbi:MAG: 30S ribosomal protein S6 [Syntrophaceae bacterium]|nr:30S ribosomal protein S6 [Syntrophaceae bacterium]